MSFSGRRRTVKSRGTRRARRPQLRPIKWKDLVLVLVVDGVCESEWSLHATSSSRRKLSCLSSHSSHRQLAGGIVVCQHPFKPILLVKRVDELSRDGELILGGLSPAESTDSRTVIFPSRFQLRGVVVAYWEN